jgi:hypothetical protein
MRLHPLALAGGLLLAGVAAPAAAAPAAVPVTHPAAAPHASTTHRVLFDDTKAETAGNADWIISTSMPDPLAQNANPTSETSWTGAISSWGVALQETGAYSLKTLPPGNTITYGNSANALDLSNFDEFVLPEPNIVLSSAEKAALMNFVHAGGGLFLISDHTGSDRNNDGWDSPAIINDLMTNNGVDNNDPFGFSVDLKNIGSDYPVAISDSGNPVLNGSFGTVKHSLIANGTTFTLDPSDNPNVEGLLYLSTATSGGNTSAAFVTSSYGSGRVAIWDDSSTVDDGTGESGKTLYDGWNDSGANDAALALNATAWLAGSGSGTGGGTVSVTNPGNQTATVGTAASLAIKATATDGGTLSYTATGLPAGLSVNSSTGVISGTPTAAGSAGVTVTVTDSTGGSASATFTWTVSSAGGGSCTSAQLLGNPGFETGSASPWTASAKVIYSGTKEPARTGSYDAWLDGYGTTTTDTLSQSVTLPTGCGSYTFGYYLHIDTAETTTSTAYDTLKVQVLNSSGTVLSTLASYSNLNKAGGYTGHTYSLAAYAGQTVTLKVTGAEDSQDQTSFVLDDASVNVS